MSGVGTGESAGGVSRVGDDGSSPVGLREIVVEQTCWRSLVNQIISPLIDINQNPWVTVSNRFVPSLETTTGPSPRSLQESRKKGE